MYDDKHVQHTILESSTRLPAASLREYVRECAMAEQTGEEMHKLQIREGEERRPGFEVADAPLWQGIRNSSSFPSTIGWKFLRIADLGCSTGEFSLTAVHKLVINLRALLEANSVDIPEDVEVFFTDLATNDFNALFRRLPPYGDGRSYFAAGLPGSFHNRLFPEDSMHAFTCFRALHFLSQVPPEVLDKQSPAYNFDSVHLRGAGPAVAQAFSQQGCRDLRAFLTNRATELVPGGFLVLGMLVSGDDVGSSEMLDLFADSVHQLAAEGVIPQELVAAFNLPVHIHSVAEVRKAVEDVGLFDMRLLQLCGGVSIFPEQKCVEYRADRRKFARDRAALWRHVFYESMETHLGVEVSNLVLQRHERDLGLLELADLEKHFVVNYCNALLAKKYTA